jgi:hypothetical protein
MFVLKIVNFNHFSIFRLKNRRFKDPQGKNGTIFIKECFDINGYRFYNKCRNDKKKGNCEIVFEIYVIYIRYLWQLCHN